MLEEKNQFKKINFLKKLGIVTDLEGRVNIDHNLMKKLRPIPVGNQYRALILADNKLMGFRVRVNAGGSKVFIYRYRPKNPNEPVLEKQTITIGTWYDNSDPRFKDKIGMTPTVARSLAKDMQFKIIKREDPYSIVKAKKKSRSLMSVCDDWIEKRVSSVNFKASTRRSIISIYNVYIKQASTLERHKKLYRQEPELFKLFKSEYKNITKDDYILIHNAISRYSKFQANRTIETLRLVEQYGIEIGVLEKRLCIFKKKEFNKEISRLDRDDPFTRSEMKRYRVAALALIKEERIKQKKEVWDHEKKLFRPYRPNYRLVPCLALLATALLGGRSISMIFSMKWDQIEYKNKIIRFINTKNNQPIILDYDYRFSAILRIMKKHQKTINHKDKRYAYVFPAADKNYKNKFCKDLRKTHATILEKAKLPFKVIHFLRHTWATLTYEATGDILAVQEMGGWRSLDAVKKYTVITREQRKNKLIQMRKYMSKSHVA